MVYHGECNSCEMGDHSHHVKNYRPAPEGMFGGAACLCEGECEKRGIAPHILAQMEPVHKALQQLQKREQEDFFQHVTDKYFPLGLDDDSDGGDPYSPTPGAW